MLPYRWGAGCWHLWIHTEEKPWKVDILWIQCWREPESVRSEGKLSKEKEIKERGKKKNSTKGRTDECEEAMLRRLYLRLGLLGWRRCGGCCCDCCWASPVATAAPPLLPLRLSWWCCRAALLLEREAPCERECWLCPWLWLWLWPSDGEGFDVPGLLWDFSIEGTCVSKTTRFTKLPKKRLPFAFLSGCHLLRTTHNELSCWLVRYWI